MEGPTPVSALIHAATMVTAGVYMIGRNAVLFSHAPFTLEVVAIVGVATALYAGTIGLVQNDIKRVLAYSTVSQLGYMFLAMGVGAFAGGIFHLFTHAFFKALLFLGSGAVIHALAGEQDMRHMGGLRKHLPVTFYTFLIGTVAIAGIPPLAGVFSKDEILWKTSERPRGAVDRGGCGAPGDHMFPVSRVLRRAALDGSAGRHDPGTPCGAHLHDAPPRGIALVPLGRSIPGLWRAHVPAANRIEAFLEPSFAAGT
jgi:NADH-quinone oxidoreductase subunit L